MLQFSLYGFRSEHLFSNRYAVPSSDGPRKRRNVALTVDFIQGSVRNGRYELSLHADEERLDEGFTIQELEDALSSLEILEEYTDDPRGPSCLALGHIDRQPVHFVCGVTRQGVLILITVYRPTVPKWKDARTRNR